VLGATALVQHLERSVIEPLVMGRALNVHPVVIVLGGVLGAIIATPVLAAGSGAFVYLRERRSAC
jgi:predicted PurR-regulated permease PerM